MYTNCEPMRKNLSRRYLGYFCICLKTMGDHTNSVATDSALVEVETISTIKDNYFTASLILDMSSN
jgi:hypothetical protein